MTKRNWYENMKLWGLRAQECLPALTVFSETHQVFAGKIGVLFEKGAFKVLASGRNSSLLILWSKGLMIQRNRTTLRTSRNWFWIEAETGKQSLPLEKGQKNLKSSRPGAQVAQCLPNLKLDQNRGRCPTSTFGPVGTDWVSDKVSLRKARLRPRVS